MEGEEQIALDIVTGYRGLLGGIGVGITSSILRNYNAKNGKLITFKSLKKSSPLFITVPIFMIGIRRASLFFEDEEKKSE